MGPALSCTYAIGAVALERGVADGERTVLNVDGTAVLMKELYVVCHVPPPDMEQRAGSERVLRQEDSKTATHIQRRRVAIKCGVRDCDCAIVSINGAALHGGCPTASHAA